jgi:hypothetical protein
VIDTIARVDRDRATVVLSVGRHFRNVAHDLVDNPGLLLRKLAFERGWCGAEAKTEAASAGEISEDAKEYEKEQNFKDLSDLHADATAKALPRSRNSRRDRHFAAWFQACRPMSHASAAAGSMTGSGQVG